jgi:dynein heavy chain
MNLVFFEDAVKHIIRVSRVLRLSRGSAMLIGIGGSGKQSLTRLAAAIANHPISQIEVSASYTHADFREDLKDCLHVAGVEAKHVVLMLSDTQVGVPPMSHPLPRPCLLHSEGGGRWSSVIAPSL